MTENEYRDLVVAFSTIAKKVGEIVKEPQYELDKTMIFYKIREASNLLRDIRHMTDLKENPNKMTVEMNTKPFEGSHDVRQSRNVSSIETK